MYLIRNARTAECPGGAAIYAKAGKPLCLPAVPEMRINLNHVRLEMRPARFQRGGITAYKR